MIQLRKFCAQEITKQALSLMAFLDKALETSRGELVSQDLIEQGYRGDVQFWEIHQDEARVGLLTTTVIDYPQGSVLRIITLTGRDLRSWAQDVDAVLEEFAQSLGCRWVEFVGRKGFEVILADLAYKPVYVVYSREVCDG